MKKLFRRFRRKRGYRFPNGIPRTLVQVTGTQQAAMVTISMGTHAESLPYNASAAEFIDATERVWSAYQEDNQ